MEQTVLNVVLDNIPQVGSIQQNRCYTFTTECSDRTVPALRVSGLSGLSARTTLVQGGVVRDVMSPSGTLPEPPRSSCCPSAAAPP